MKTYQGDGDGHLTAQSRGEKTEDVLTLPG